MNTSSKAISPSLVPKASILWVSSNGVTELKNKSIVAEVVGQKAVGLACLPSAWTLPFVVVSKELYERYRDSEDQTSKIALLKKWESPIRRALKIKKISGRIIVRSSGCSEGMNQRGRFHSAAGDTKTILSPLTECLERLIADRSNLSENVPFAIQKLCVDASAWGHLSNERRCNKEKRDWMGELQMRDIGQSSAFQINLRNWRKKINISKCIDLPLSCTLSARISEALKIPAAWGSQQNIRLHFEWIWDGKGIYIVQADRESHLFGVNPIGEHTNRSYIPISYKPACLKKVDTAHASKFSKIKNVLTYLQLGLPTAPLYILNDQKIIKEISEGNIRSNLRRDLEYLSKGSLVIRSDVVTEDLRKRQLLPRSHEIRSLDQTINWLIKQSKILIKRYIDSEIAFIFHNFIPALSSAFAYATPRNRNVLIEALWGLPEGLYYNSHDKYLVDTKIVDPSLLKRSEIRKFELHERTNFKHFFVSADANGTWVTRVVAPPYDWRGSLSKDWCKIIAFESRRIAAFENRPVSIMWFAGLSEGLAKSPVIPWYHEPFSAKTSPREITHRKKTIFDKSLVVQSSSDIELLRKETKQPESNIKRIRIQPTDDALLRDKDTLKKIGGFARKLEAVIVLEGAILSHAYYQLSETGAVVEVVNPFTGFDERQEFNKLVRDNIPEGIELVGESATTAHLQGEALINALRDKLVEEAFEVLDATDLNSIVEELADVSEIIDELICQLGVSKRMLLTEQAKKKRNKGGFKKGIVLLETRNLPPTAEQNKNGEILSGFESEISKSERTIGEQELQRRGHHVEKWTDRREDGQSVELKLQLQVPVIRRDWSGVTLEQRILDPDEKTVRGEVRGKRHKSQWRVELSVFVDAEHPDLFRFSK